MNWEFLEAVIVYTELILLCILAGIIILAFCLPTKCPRCKSIKIIDGRIPGWYKCLECQKAWDSFNPSELDSL